MQSIHHIGQHTHRPVPLWASARDHAYRQIRPRDPPPQTMVWLCLVTQEILDDITQERITHLIQFMPDKCRIVHEAHVFLQPSLTLLHLTILYTEQNATINFGLTNHDSRQIANLTHINKFISAVFTLIKFSLEIYMHLFFCSVYIYCHEIALLFVCVDECFNYAHFVWITMGIHHDG